MKQLLLIVSFLFIGIISITTQVDAHILKTDGTIGAVLHIDPQDSPVVGEPAYFFFEFKDKTGKLNLSECECTISISKNDEIIFSQPLLVEHESGTLHSSSQSFIFLEKGIYIVQLSGNPATGDSFQSFVLTYDVRVDRTSVQQEHASADGSDHWIHFALFFVVLGGVVIWYAMSNVRSKKKKKIKHSKLLILIIVPLYTLTILGHVVHSSHEPSLQQKIADASCCTLTVSEKVTIFTPVIRYSHATTIKTIVPTDVIIILISQFHNRSPPSAV